MRALSTALAAFAVASFPSRSDACSCIDPGSVAAGFDASGSVLEGKVLSLQHQPAAHRISARLEVLQRWKGASGKTVEVVTTDQGSMCGFEFRRGERYLIFAQATTSPLSVSICSLSKPSNGAAEDIAELNRLAKAGSGSGTVPASPEGGAADAGEPAAPPEPPSSGPTSSKGAAPAATQPPPVPPVSPKPAERRAPGGSCMGCSFPRGGASSELLLGLAAALLVTRAARRRRSGS
ncbi:MAG TPA: hypothetical protein VI072_20775 [Polyangiaceae bacterium]